MRFRAIMCLSLVAYCQGIMCASPSLAAILVGHRVTASIDTFESDDPFVKVSSPIDILHGPGNFGIPEKTLSNFSPYTYYVYDYTMERVSDRAKSTISTSVVANVVRGPTRQEIYGEYEFGMSQQLWGTRFGEGVWEYTTSFGSDFVTYLGGQLTIQNLGYAHVAPWEGSFYVPPAELGPVTNICSVGTNALEQISFVRGGCPSPVRRTTENRGRSTSPPQENPIWAGGA